MECRFTFFGLSAVLVLLLLLVFRKNEQKLLIAKVYCAIILLDEVLIKSLTVK